MNTQTNVVLDSNEMTLNRFFAKIYTWMSVGILFTALVAFLTLSTSLGAIVYGSKVMFYGVVGLEIAIMFGAQMLINKLPVSMSRFLFFLYAGLNGITITGILVQFSPKSVMGVFLISAALFGILAIFGYTTKKNLSGWRTFLYIGMLGVFVSSIVNMFLQNSVFDTVLSGIAVLIFCGLTVYDNQIYKIIYEDSKYNTDALEKASALGALHMYMNFIMIFINLLKLFGQDD